MLIFNVDVWMYINLVFNKVFLVYFFVMIKRVILGYCLGF